ncbi:MAG TPA: glycosyltransferase [Nitrososphaeraceae archaeon]|nr:glycosyltransferase [Nitrososphaeraceae archaeon]
MKANVIHGDFNPCGGAERLALVTMQALLEMGIDFDLTTLKSPDISKLENSYGKKLVSVMKSINKINIINILEELRHQKQQQQQLQLQKQQQQQKKNYNDYNYDITINTNGDAAPYYHPSFSKNNTITYCHFPSTKYHIDSESIDYLKTDLGLTEQSIFLSHHKEFEDSINNSKNYKTRLQFNNNSSSSSGRISEYYELIKYGYWNLMRNSTVITNSEFSQRAIVDAMGLDNIYILNPPIDIETFHNVALTSDVNNNNNNNNNPSNNIILVIARIAPHKKIENAIKLAKILKDNNIGKGMKIVGNLYYYFFDYYSEIKQMVLDLDLTDYITFEINANLDKLLSIIRESRIYFHPMIGEHFGISVLEAMAAGLIPVVPNEGGVKEFVPSKYQFNSIEHAAEIIKNIFNHVPNKERIQINNNINKFSSSHYIKEFQIILNKLLYQRKLQ